MSLPKIYFVDENSKLYVVTPSQAEIIQDGMVNGESWYLGCSLIYEGTETFIDKKGRLITRKLSKLPKRYLSSR